MPASLEILSGLIRLGDNHYKFGDDFTVSITFSADGGTAIVKGIDKPLTFKEGKQVRDILKQYGLKMRYHTKRSQQKEEVKDC